MARQGSGCSFECIPSPRAARCIPAHVNDRAEELMCVASCMSAEVLSCASDRCTSAQLALHTVPRHPPRAREHERCRQTVPGAKHKCRLLLADRRGIPPRVTLNSVQTEFSGRRARHGKSCPRTCQPRSNRSPPSERRAAEATRHASHGPTASAYAAIGSHHRPERNSARRRGTQIPELPFAGRDAQNYLDSFFGRIASWTRTVVSCPWNRRRFD